MSLAPTAPPPTSPSESPEARVRRLAKEIEVLGSRGLPPQEYFQVFLEKVVLAVGSPAGAVWLMDQGKCHLSCEIRMKTTGFNDNPDAMKLQRQLLAEAAENGQSRLIHPNDELQEPLPKKHLIILTGLRVHGSCAGFVEIFHREDIPTSARTGYLHFVEQMTGFASMYLERKPGREQDKTKGEFDEELARFGLQLQRSLRIRDVATVAANDGRLLSDCDRVSVVIQRGRKIQVKAISGQQTVHRRANLVKTMIQLSREIIRSGVAVKYTGETDSFSPQVKDRLAAFVQETGARMVFVVPMRIPVPLVASDRQEQRPSQPGKVFGCLVLEKFHESEPGQALTDRLDWMTRYCAAALHNAATYQSLFLLPLWQLLGKLGDWLYGRRLLKTLAAVAVIAAATSALVFVETDFRIEADGRSMPVVRREIFVPYDGEVVDVLVSSGERVAEGQLLVRLRNNELRSELIATESQRDEKRNLLAALLAERDEVIRGPLGERGHRIDGELGKTRAELKGLERRLQALDERERQLNVTSPIAGVVSTFEVDQLLRHRPVRRGEILMEVMDDAGPWQLELDVSADRTGHLFQARKSASDPLPIEYLLVTSPERTHSAQLTEVGSRVETSQNNLPVVEVLASLDADPQMQRRIGAEVRAKIHCGRKSLGYALFGDVIEFVQKYLWF